MKKKTLLQIYYISSPRGKHDEKYYLWNKYLCLSFHLVVYFQIIDSDTFMNPLITYCLSIYTIYNIIYDEKWQSKWIKMTRKLHLFNGECACTSLEGVWYKIWFTNNSTQKIQCLISLVPFVHIKLVYSFSNSWIPYLKKGL